MKKWISSTVLFLALDGGESIRTFTYSFHAKPSTLPLGNQLQFTHTQLYQTWPSKRFSNLPRTMNAAVVNEEQILVGPPIHVEAGGRLLLNLQMILVTRDCLFACMVFNSVVMTPKLEASAFLSAL
jgi:hypothetical protein